MKTLKVPCFFLWMLLLLSFNIQGQVKERLDVTISQQEVTIEETFRMVVSANRVGEKDNLDVSSLTENFEIVDINFDKYSYLTNKQLSNSSTWIITLRPKTTGELTIPTLILGQASSPEDYIEVVDVDEELAKKEPPLRIETRLSQSVASLGQDVLYTILVYQEPEVVRRRIYQNFPAKIIATQLGQDEYIIEYEVGKPVKFSRRYYVLNALEEGNFEIPAPTFTGVARTRNQGNFGRIFSTEEEVSVMGDSAKIQVTSLSEQGKEKSLLASEITLTASWQSTTFRVGEPNLLTVNLRAVGIIAERLPDILINLPESLRGYPEDIKREVSVKRDDLIANLSSTIAIIPTLAGEVSIPDITLGWYNVDSKKTDQTTLSFNILSIQESKISPGATRLTTNWYTDFRLYILLCLILMITHVVHVRKLKVQLVKKEKETSKIKSPLIINLHTVINCKNDKELPLALKVYLDDKLYKQPSLTHHQKSQILKKLSPKLCSLIERYFDSIYGRRVQVQSSFKSQPLSDDFYLSLKVAIEEFEALIKKDPLSKLPLSERYIY